MSDLNFDLSRPLKVKCDGGIGLPMCSFLLVFDSNTWPNSIGSFLGYKPTKFE